MGKNVIDPPITKMTKNSSLHTRKIAHLCTMFLYDKITVFFSKFEKNVSCCTPKQNNQRDKLFCILKRVEFNNNSEVKFY